MSDESEGGIEELCVHKESRYDTFHPGPSMFKIFAQNYNRSAIESNPKIFAKNHPALCLYPKE